jgi:sterol desaturase/sphingolipid hydroxylase (fatty acid hydroxylase superfamily)
VVFAAVVAVGAIAGFAASLLDASTTAAARGALSGLLSGDLLQLTAAEGRGLLILALVVLVQPLAVIGVMLCIELWAGPRQREAKNYLLTWSVQAVFLTCATFLGLMGAKLGLLPKEPLFKVAPGAGIAGLLLQTLPLYLLALFVADFFRYWFHRAQHRFPILWHFHAVHHSPRDLDVLHNITHPLEQLGNLFLVAIPAAFLIGVDAGQLYLLSAFFAVQGHLLHMNVPVHFGPLRYLLCDNRYHFIHHSRDPADFDSNFAGMFPLLDRLFGTYREPRPGPLPETGFDGHGPTRFSHYLTGRWPGHERSR